MKLIYLLIGMAIASLFIFLSVTFSEPRDNRDCGCKYFKAQLQALETKYEQLKEELYETIIEILRLKADLNKEEKIMPRPDILKPELY